MAHEGLAVRRFLAARIQCSEARGLKFGSGFVLSEVGCTGSSASL